MATESSCQTQEAPCCCGAAPAKVYRYRSPKWVTGTVDTPAGVVRQASSRLTARDKLGALRVRSGIARMDFRVEPGLYAVGRPTPTSPVLVTANYKLSFDHLRRELASIDAWILVLDTFGVNVWCAAGKGTFSSDELNKRIAATGLEKVVEHRTVVVPQLGATGVAKHVVREGSGFSVVFGPVRAADLPAFLAARMRATPDMRRVRFGIGDRAAVIGVELSTVWNWRTIGFAVVAAFLAGLAGADRFSPSGYGIRLAIVYGLTLLPFIGGGVLVPLGLPIIPGRAFSLKGALVGVVLGAAAVVALRTVVPLLALIGIFLGVCAASSYAAMNFTGATTFTSPSGVQKEMRRSLPLQIGGAAAAVLLFIAQFIVLLVA